MKYRKLGKLDWEPSALGFGCMRLPTPDGIALNPNIIQEDTNELFRVAFENGINYFDTAYGYHSGKSEEAVGKGIAPFRDKVKVATKAPLVVMKSAADYDRILDEQLKRLQLETIDFYLFHNINKPNWELMKREDLFGRAEAALKAGKIQHIAFSFHDSYELFEEVLNSYDKWLFCQVQHNFVDVDFQAGEKGIAQAVEKGVGVVVMEPLKGGKLVENVHPEIKRMIAERGVETPLAELALKWVWSKREVSLVLSGMGNMEQLTQNINTANSDYKLTENELGLLSDIKAFYDSRATIPCTGCMYCQPCPQNVNIPHLLALYNDGVAYDYFKEPSRVYNVTGKQAQRCTDCGVCAEKCPQGIPINEWMPKIDKALS